MNTITGGVQVLDDDRRWVARITYTTVGSDLIPIATEVRLRPPCPGHPQWVEAVNYDDDDNETLLRYFRDDQDVLHVDGQTDAQPPEGPCDCGWPADPLGSVDLAPIPYPGLTGDFLRRISIAGDITRTREAFHTVLALDAAEQQPASPLRTVARSVTAEPDAPRVGRKRRDRLTVLRVLRLYQQGERIEDIAVTVGFSAGWVKDALSWSRREKLLVGGRGRGARGGFMTKAAEAELAALEATDHG